MCKKMLYLISILVLGLAGRGWSYASNPSPPDGAIHMDTWASLSWRPGEHAVSFDIYIGENYNDVKNGARDTFRGNQSTMFFVVGFPGFPYPEGLVPGTTYYWRVDEINDQHPDSPSVGDVWSFKIPSSTAYDPEPADGAVLVDPNVTLSWEPGYRAKLHTVFFGDSYEQVSNASEGRPQGTTTYSPRILESGKTYYWRVDEFDGVRTYKGDVWRFSIGAGWPSDGEEGVIYVDAVHGNDRNNGLTPRTAFATIQRGIDVVADGVVVLVYPGLYLEEINFLGKTITVQGVAVSPAGVPVLWNPDDFAVSFYSSEGPDSILKNFIIKDSFMGVFIADSSPTLSNLTIVDNKYGIEAYANSEPDISNTILWNNTDGDLFQCQARYSCIERGGEGEGNIDADPLFVDTDGGDYHIHSVRGRYWPAHDVWVLDKVTSPCVDAGDPNADYSGEPMPNGGCINIGAYGDTSEASLSPWQTPLPLLPDQASNPNPVDGAIDVDLNVKLSWTAGINTIWHEVYFGTNPTPGAAELVSEQQTDTTFQFISDLIPHTTFYWCVDEINCSGKTTGEIWTFTTGSALPPLADIIELTDATFDQTVYDSVVPVLVDFYADWCPYSRMMDPIIQEIADEYAGKAKICKINADDARETAMEFGITSIPTFILFKDGQVQRTWVGVTSKEDLTAAIDELLLPPPPKGRGCFLADTPVWVNGALAQISNVISGHLVDEPHCDLATDCLEQIETVEEHEGTFECRDIVLESGNLISVVDAHCFMLDSGQWIAAQDLRCGLRLKTLSGTIGIKSVATRATPFVGKVYNLKIKGGDRYFVGKDRVIVRDY